MAISTSGLSRAKLPLLHIPHVEYVTVIALCSAILVSAWVGLTIPAIFLTALSAAIILIYYSEFTSDAYVILLLFGPPLLQGLDFVGTGLRLDFVFLYAAFVLLFLSKLANRVPLGMERVSLTYLAYFGLGLFSTIAGPWFWGQSWDLTHLAWIQGFLRPLIVFLLVYWLVNRREDIRRLLMLILVAGTVVTGLGILQALDVQPFESFIQAHYPPKQGIEQTWTSGRTTSIFDGSQNRFGVFFVVFIPTLLSFYLIRRRAISTLFTFLLPVTIVLTLIALTTTGSRSAFLSVAVSMVAFVLLLPWRARLRILLGIVLFSGVVLVAINTVDLGRTNRVLNNYAQGIETRLKAWEGHIEQFTINPIFGTGRPPGKQVPDSQYVQELHERGLLGLLILLSLIGVVLHRAFRLYKLGPPGSLDKLLGLAVWGATLGLAVNAGATTVFIGGRTGELYWILVALGVSLLAQKRRANKPAVGSETLNKPREADDPAYAT